MKGRIKKSACDRMSRHRVVHQGKKERCGFMNLVSKGRPETGYIEWRILE
jgi:hypothetical protein